MGYITEERRLMARAFALKEVLPLANKLDPEKADIASSASSSPNSMAVWAWASSNIA